MNLPIAIFALYVALCLGLLFFYRRGLFFLLPITLIVFATMRFQAGFPLYLFDVSAALVLFVCLREGALRAWPRAIAPVHYILMGLLVFTGFVVPLFRYGFSTQSLWVTGHAMLAYAQVITGVALVCIPALKASRQHLVWGIVVALAALAIIVWLQFGNPGMSRTINAFFFRDQTTSQTLTEFGAKLMAQRAAGPFGNPNIPGVIGILGAFVVWLLASRRWALLAFALAVAIVIPTVSRQAILALVLCLAIWLITGAPKTRIAGFALLALVPLASPIVASIPSLAPTIERFSRWQGGALEDNNVSGRLLDGPARLWNLIVEKPDTAVVGAGWDVQKLMSQGVDVGIYGTGFVSNSFLLWLYFAGVIGLLFILFFFGRLLQAALKARGDLRARSLAIVFPLMFLYFSDNGGILIEAFVNNICLLWGLIVAFQLRQERLIAASAAPRWTAEPDVAEMPAQVWVAKDTP
jgi:hypothetical protein